MNDEVLGFFDEIKRRRKNPPHYSIIVHDNPDPDAFASALGIQALLEKFKAKSTIYWHGELTHVQNRIFCNVLKIDAVKLNARDIAQFAADTKDDPIIVVDSSTGLGRANLMGVGVFFSGRKADCTLDHHQIIEQENAYWNAGTGSCSTMVFQLLKHYEVPISRKLAVALVIGIKLDTDDLRKAGVTDEDKQAHDALMELIDPEKYLKIINYPQPPSIIPLRASAYGSLRQKNDLVFCSAGIILPEHQSQVAGIADEILRIETIQHCCVISILNPGEGANKRLSVSFRNTGDVINTDEFMKSVFGPTFGGRDGSGGGSIELDTTLSSIIDNALSNNDNKALDNILKLLNDTYFHRLIVEKAKLS